MYEKTGVIKLTELVKNLNMLFWDGWRDCSQDILGVLDVIFHQILVYVSTYHNAIFSSPKPVALGSIAALPIDLSTIFFATRCN